MQTAVVIAPPAETPEIPKQPKRTLAAVRTGRRGDQ
jgi:hypothetical protein